MQPNKHSLVKCSADQDSWFQMFVEDFGLSQFECTQEAVVSLPCVFPFKKEEIMQKPNSVSRAAGLITVFLL